MGFLKHLFSNLFGNHHMNKQYGQGGKHSKPSSHDGAYTVSSPANTLSCPQCHTPVTSAARFCQTCGSSLSPTTCSCGASLAPGAKFCSQCGKTAS